MLCLAFLLFACSKSPEENRFREWRLEDDIAAFEIDHTNNPERYNRSGWLSDALDADAYHRFIETLTSAPSGKRALIYYEVSGANGLAFFALAVEGRHCEVFTSDEQAGDAQSECEGIPIFALSVDDVRVPFSDPVVAGLVQYDPGHAPIRAMTLLPKSERKGVPRDGDLVNKVRRVFSAHENEDYL